METVIETHTVGQIEAVGRRDSRLVVRGWLASRAAEIENFELRFGHRFYPDVEFRLGLPSPAIARFYPQLPDGDRCGFEVGVPLDPDDHLKGEIVHLTPILGSGGGRTLLGVAEPIVAPPSPEELALVTRNLSAAFEFLGYFVDFARLQPADHVLDIGCGVGRMAYPLAHYLSPEGRYEGFDIDRRFIEVAQRRFGALSNFRFRFIDVSNGMYNRAGELDAASFTFPYPDDCIDFVLLASVFTHMRPPAVQRYLAEVHRVLRPGGRALASMFLIDAESERCVAEDRSRVALRHELGGFYAQDPERPEGAIGYRSEVVADWLAERGFVFESLHPGSWCGRAYFTSFQDLALFSLP